MLMNFFWGWILKACILVQKKKIVSGLHVHHIIKRKIWQFHVVVVQRSVMHVRSCSFANLILQDGRRCKKLPNFGLVCYTEGARQFEVLSSLRNNFLRSRLHCARNQISSNIICRIWARHRVLTIHHFQSFENKDNLFFTTKTGNDLFFFWERWLS